MAGGKKKKKPAANPARGFATTSQPSKHRQEQDEEAAEAAKSTTAAAPPSASQATTAAGPSSAAATTTAAASTKTLSPEEFERQLEESELQLLVEKYAAKVRRDVQRQLSRLETDRRLLRSQSDPINVKKWMPQELVDEIFHLVQAESRYASSSVSSEGATSGKMLAEEDMTYRLWALQLTLLGLGLPQARVDTVIRYVIDIAPTISTSTKDSLWGLEESLDWLARECPDTELPEYDRRPKQVLKQTETPTESPVPSRVNSPRPSKGQKGAANAKGPRPQPPSKKIVAYDGEIEPDDLIPEYIHSRAKLFDLERSRQETRGRTKAADDAESLEMAKLQGKIDYIENDVLFDKQLANEQWRSKRILLEKEYAAARKQKAREAEDSSTPKKPQPGPASEDVNAEAERITAELLAQEAEDDALAVADLFASLPTTEVDSVTGKINTVVNGKDGSKVIIRDFGKWTGVSPVRALDEACRSRDSSVKISYTLVSDISYANRHSVTIQWTKSQEPLEEPTTSGVDVASEATVFNLTMSTISTPDSKQSEAFIATFALFQIFGTSPKEEKVFLRLPPVWRELWNELAEARKSVLDAKDRTVVKEIRALVRKRQDQEMEDGVILQGAFKGRGVARAPGEAGEDSGQDGPKLAQLSPEYFQKIWTDKASSPRYQQMLQSRMQLPMWHFRQQVLDAVDHEQVVIICGETGCGKSTQVPSFLLEHQLSQGKPCKVYCTEPRRISAVSLARRVSEELGESKSDLGTSRSLVGYAIRLESNTSRDTRLVYATTGIVMRMLEGSGELREITHLVLDEVHERTIDSDFLLIVLKKLMMKRKDLKVILMSATVDAERFSAYLGGAPILNVPGRTFPVRVQYLEDAVEFTGYTIGQKQETLIDLDDDVVESDSEKSKADATKDLSLYSTKTRSTMAQLDEYRIEFDLIVELIIKISSDLSYMPYSKAILVFLPGIAEIRALNDLLLGNPAFQTGWYVYPLHSTIATEEQEAAFLVPPPGVRKIVLATNIAETGITIPDVTCVIDTGKHREMRFDERRQLSRLIDTFISRANAKQRRGRAGRVQQGLCFHMFSKYRHDTLMADQQTPEMLRLSLQDLAIRVKICKIGGIEETLSQALDAPSAKNIRRAIDALVDVRALTAAEELTPLGHQLARLPLDVFLGKLILLGTVFRCLDAAITVAAILSSKPPFSAPFGQRAQADAARMAFRRGDSDVLTVYNAYLAWKRVCQANAAAGGKEFQFCRKNYLNQQTLSNIEDLKGQLLVSLVDSGFLSLTKEERQALSKMRYSSNYRGRRQQQFFELPQRVNMNSDNDAITASIIAWSFYPKLLVRDVPGTKGLRNIGNNQSISLHPTSVNKGHNELRWLSYYHIMQSKAVYHAHETTAADAFAIALLCGDVRCDMFSGVMILDGNRAKFSVPDWKTAFAIKVLRARLRELLTRSFKFPGKLPTAQHERWLEVWQRIFALEPKDGSGSGVVK